jgi:hypothetical protein
MAKIIAVANQKGDTAKSTSAEDFKSLAKMIVEGDAE